LTCSLYFIYFIQQSAHFAKEILYNNYKKLTIKKKKAYKQWRRTLDPQDKQHYWSCKAEAKKQVSIAKHEHYSNLYHQLETKEGEKDIYRLAKARHEKTKDISSVRIVRANDGRILYNDKDILARWKEHYETISTIEFPTHQSPRVHLSMKKCRSSQP
jgi:Fe-S cluster assembly scaffold protein SufB